jgi:hypothetical protein
MDNKISPDDIANKEELCLEGYLECPIDNMVSLNPLMCKKCETIFCPNCIEDWKKRSNVCPMRCNPIELIKTDKTIIRQQLNKIKLFCPFLNNGCLEKVMINELPRHERLCEYRTIECDKCREKVPNIAMIGHIFEQCNSRKIQCPQCDIFYSLKDLCIHFQQCNTPICNFCFEAKTLNHNCQYELRECMICNLPELSGNLNNHRCADKNLNSSVWAYLKNLYTKIESNLNGRIMQRDLKYKEFTTKVNEISQDVIKRLAEKENALESKILEAKEKSYKRINVIKRDKYEELEKSKNELKNFEKCILGMLILIIRY